MVEEGPQGGYGGIFFGTGENNEVVRGWVKYKKRTGDVPGCGEGTPSPPPLMTMESPKRSYSQVVYWRDCYVLFLLFFYHWKIWPNRPIYSLITGSFTAAGTSTLTVSSATTGQPGARDLSYRMRNCQDGQPGPSTTTSESTIPGSLANTGRYETPRWTYNTGFMPLRIYD